MIAQQLFQPSSIAVVGASENPTKPGGKVLTNLLRGRFAGPIYAVNKKPVHVEGTIYCADIAKMPPVDLAIISIPAKDCIDVVGILLEKGTRAFILFSAGFGEAGPEGQAAEETLVKMIDAAGASLIGPNCIGVIHATYKGVFTEPVPDYDPGGCELISSSGATAIFIMEAGIQRGLRFSNVYSIGNAAQTGVEDLLEYMDEQFTEDQARVKLLYLEDICNPFKFMKHAASLIRKGCKIAAIKSGYSEAGGRAASSHTGALATADNVVRALFKKSGIVYCSGRDELITAGCIFQSKELPGDRLAMITHAGGSAVMLTDALTSGGLQVPRIPPEVSADLLNRLNPGSSVANPIDFLATGTASHLADIIDFCERCDGIDGMIVVFGSPGLFASVRDVYEVIHNKMTHCKKPIYPVLPSLINARREIEEFLAQGHVNFSDEVVLGKALPFVHFRPKPTFGMTHLAPMETATIRSIISQAEDGFLDPQLTRQLLQAAGIRMVETLVCNNQASLEAALRSMHYPIVLKAVGPVHKTDVGGVALNLNNREQVLEEYRRLIKIPDAKAVQIQEMKFGEELYCGAIRQGQFGHLVLCGLGGIFLEVLNDVANGLAPLNEAEARNMVRSLKAYKIIRGYRNRPGVNEDLFVDAVVRVASLVHLAPEIAELDINPFKGCPGELVAVDARIRIEK
ncbi:MAG: acetate--CoA ligase family protein [Saprospiraceae bacterium]|nr:acetate--CoA ligase family protein [Saprospiraceae bacterium]